MTTIAQDVLFTNDIEMTETPGGWMPKYVDDYDKVIASLEESAIEEEYVGEATHYTFEDDSVVIQAIDENLELAFDHYK